MTVETDVLLDSMVAALRRLVSTESPSSDPAGLKRCASVLADLGEEILGVRPDVSSGDHPVVRWSFGAKTRVLLIGHLDTVWPLGTIDRWPFSLSDGIATGPGVFDMKAGIVIALHAIASLTDRDGVTLLVTSDEELGSPTSQELIETLGREAEAALVLEPGASGALKVARKGCSTYVVTAHGRASHAGLNPWDGANALVAVAHAILDCERIASGGTTVTPTVAKAGTTTNTVPAFARVYVDVRAETIAEQQRVDAELKSLTSRVDGVVLEIEREVDRPPLERSMAQPLFDRAQAITKQLGLGPLEAIEVGGGSDGNFTAAVGTPTLDGLGAIGDGAHAEGEHVQIESLPKRVALVAALIRELQAKGKGQP